MNWRPDDWENPHGAVWGNLFTGDAIPFNAYEQGADAMLKALKKGGIEVEVETYLLADKAKRREIIAPKVKGRLVFTPDDETAD